MKQNPENNEQESQVVYRIVHFPPDEECNKDTYAVYALVVHEDGSYIIFSDEAATLYGPNVEQLHIEAFNLMEAFTQPVLEYDDLWFYDYETEMIYPTKGE